MSKMSTYELLGFPDMIGIILFVLGLVLTLGAFLKLENDLILGNITIPRISPDGRKPLKIVGPLVLMFSLGSFVPLWSPGGFDKEKPVLQEPRNGNSFPDDQRTMLFKWKSMPGAVQYIVEIKQDTLATTPSIRVPIATDSLSFDLPEENHFFWRVEAINDEGTNSLTSDRWEFFFLNTNPSADSSQPSGQVGSPPDSTHEPVELTDSLGMQFVLIPPGKFEMGSDNSDDEKPKHIVEISRPFYMSKYEVTQGQWQEVMGTTLRQQRDKAEQQQEQQLNLRGEGAEHPVYYVSWEEAQDFVTRLNDREHCACYRLPTEAEWEYASRAGSTTAYIFGNDEEGLGEYAWYKTNSTTEVYTRGSTHRVGQKKPNAFGLYDVHGNVWEWVQDWYGAYQPDSIRDPSGAMEGSERVFRGGSWSNWPWNCRLADRHKAAPDFRNSNIGFRLVRAVQ